MMSETTGHRLAKAGLFAWLGLLFLQPFNYFGALRLICMGLLLPVLIWVLVTRNPLQRLRWNPALLIACTIAGWAVAVSAFGPYPTESLTALRKDFLVQALILLGAVAFVRSVADIWKMLTVALAGFAAVSLLSLWEIGRYWLENGFSLVIPRTHASYWGGYAAIASLYLPLLLGWLLKTHRGSLAKLSGWGLFLSGSVLVILYGSRTPFPVIAIACLALILFLRRWRTFVCAIAIMAVAAGAIQLTANTQLARYQTLLKSDTYVTNSGLSQRLSVWEGAWEVISDRPWTGYGFGWKKLAWVINEQGYAERWRNERSDIATYYLDNAKAAYGKVNPHNYVLQVMFEIGAIGLALALAFWLTIFKTGTGLLRQVVNLPARELAAVLLATLTAYALANITNGQWIGGLANLSIACAACLLVLEHEIKEMNSDVTPSTGLSHPD